MSAVPTAGAGPTTPQNASWGASQGTSVRKPPREELLGDWTVDANRSRLAIGRRRRWGHHPQEQPVGGNGSVRPRSESSSFEFVAELEGRVIRFATQDAALLGNGRIEMEALVTSESADLIVGLDGTIRWYEEDERPHLVLHLQGKLPGTAVGRSGQVHVSALLDLVHS